MVPVPFLLSDRKMCKLTIKKIILTNIFSNNIIHL